MYILGDWNWRLPAWLTWLHQLHVESAETETQGPPPAPRGTALASDER
jgi:hypothetical protein